MAHREAPCAVARRYVPHAIGKEDRLDEGSGCRAIGDPVEAIGLKGEVEQFGDRRVVLRLSDPVPGLLLVFIWGKDEDATSFAHLEGYLFSEDAAAYVDRETPSWKAWLESLAGDHAAGPSADSGRLSPVDR